MIHYEETAYNIKYGNLKDEDLRYRTGIVHNDLRSMLGAFRFCGITEEMIWDGYAKWKEKYIKPNKQNYDEQ